MSRVSTVTITQPRFSRHHSRRLALGGVNQFDARYS
jgi:hypothetical protein